MSVCIKQDRKTENWVHSHLVNFGLVLVILASILKDEIDVASTFSQCLVLVGLQAQSEKNSS